MNDNLFSNIFDLNIKTVIGILFWGNLLISILIFAFYSIYKNSDTRKVFFMYGFSKLAQGLAWFLFLSRDFMPDWLSINMANICLFASFYLESLVLLTIINKDRRQDINCQKLILYISLIGFNLVEIFLPYRYTITAASIVAFSIFVVPTFQFLNSRKSNRFHLIFGLTYLLFLLLLLARSIYPFFNPDVHIFSNDLIQRGTFLAILILLMFSGTGLLLLVLLDGNEKIKNAKTELEKATAAITESEARFRSYFDLPLVGITITSLEKGWLEVNAEICKILDYSHEELKTLTWADLT